MEFFLKQLCSNFETYRDQTAFVIEGESFTYGQLAQLVANIQQVIDTFDSQQYFAVVTRNSIYTYATIFALWLSGKTSVPISAKNPHHRNQFILDSVQIKTVFDSAPDQVSFERSTIVGTYNLGKSDQKPTFVEVPLSTDLYLLFTSGSTGLPKGVRISRENLDAYLNAFFGCGYQIDSSDRCMNVFELTFDASVQCYTFPLMVGASVYTTDEKGVKFLSILKILKEHQITFVKMTPSAIFYLQPYFDQINLPYLRYCLFGAEAFPVNLVQKWQNSIPNAIIHNVYGPTEATINCTFYSWKREGINKSRNGIATIGKPYTLMEAMVCDKNQQEVEAGQQGELCLSGPQVTKGYWNNREQNEKAFFEKPVNGRVKRFYRTGDVVIKDTDGDLLFVGRIDAQVQIDGHRIELGEIEHYALEYSHVKSVALATQSDGLSNQIVLFVESEQITEIDLMAYLRKKLPAYMIPAKVLFLKNIPLLSSGKTDRKSLMKML